VHEAASIRVEPARESEIPLILQMTRALAVYERVPQAVVATEALLRSELFGEHPAAEAAIAYSGEEPAGMAVFFQTFSTFQGRTGIYLEDIFVEDRFRGRGIGKALMAYVARRAVERGCARFEWSVLNWNEPAIGFYRSLGARPLDDWTTYRLSGEALSQLGES